MDLSECSDDSCPMCCDDSCPMCSDDKCPMYCDDNPLAFNLLETYSQW